MVRLPAFHLPPRAARDLGFREVQEILRGLCASVFGREALLETPFPETLEALEGRLDDALEARTLADLRVAPAFGGVSDIRPTLAVVEKQGVLGPGDLLEVARSLDAMGRVRDLILSRQDELPRLSAQASQIDELRDFTQRVLGAFDEEGNLTDDASPALKELRSRVRALRLEAQDALQDLIRTYDDQGLLRDRNFTVRHERYVLPVKAEHQGLIEGIVHDASQTGQTVFIEPRALMTVGNRITIAQAAAKEEEQRILAEMTDEVRVRIPRIMDDTERLGELEATYARGVLASRIDGRRPVIAASGAGNLLDLLRARHPVLAWMRAEQARAGGSPAPVVPNHIGFGGRQALVVTGPNAGGKTVSLKTVGLVAAMVRAGLPVPVSEDSVVPLYSAVLAVVGDDQDLAEDLSSFSGHLVALTSVLDAAVAHRERGPVLCLLDELCSGTAPTQGAALAQGVLEELTARGAFVVATTHFEQLKTLAILDTEGTRYRNASVALDPVSGRPTFELRLDEVGSSSAFDAARRHGLPVSIIERAESLADPTGQEVQTLLQRLSEQNNDLHAKREALDAERRRLEAKNRELEEKLERVREEAARLRAKGADAFLGEIADARKKVAEAIEAAQRGATARELNELSHDLKAEQGRVQERASAPKLDLPEAAPSSLAVGDQVRITSMPGAVFDVVQIDGDEVVVAKGALKIRRPRADVRVAGAGGGGSGGGGGKKKSDRPAGPKPTSSEPRTQDNTLDLRGARVEEGLELMDAFLDKMMHQGRTRAFVLHGHGTGAMKKAVRDHARQSSYVTRWGAAEREDGGDAITVLELGD